MELNKCIKSRRSTIDDKNWLLQKACDRLSFIIGGMIFFAILLIQQKRIGWLVVFGLTAL